MDLLAELFAAHPSLHLPLAALAAVLLDQILGEPRRFHPLTGFGRLVAWLEAALNRAGGRGHGLLAWCLAVLPLLGLAFWLRQRPGWGWYLDVLLGYLPWARRASPSTARPCAGPWPPRTCPRPAAA